MKRAGRQINVWLMVEEGVAGAVAGQRAGGPLPEAPSLARRPGPLPGDYIDYNTPIDCKLQREHIPVLFLS